MIGPVFTREAVTAPRRTRHYVARVVYTSGLLVLMCTAWLVLAGTQVVRNVGDMARFGSALFQILAPLQLALVIFYSAMSAASAVAQEKDRRTLVLLLLTNLTNSELVLGKLLASMLQVLVLLAAALPPFMLCLLFGGISVEQVARVFAVTLATALAAGSLGSTLALWRERTFQALALTALVIVFWFVGCEIVRFGIVGARPLGIDSQTLAACISPWHAVIEATRPMQSDVAALGPLANPVRAFVCVMIGLSAMLNLVAIVRVRQWNTAQDVTRQPPEEAGRESIWGVEHDLAKGETAGGATTVESISPGAPAEVATAVAAATSRPVPRGLPSRRVWDNPILWREVRTRAYGRRMLVIKLAYLVLFIMIAAALFGIMNNPEGDTRTEASLALAALFLVSMVLVNAQAVTALTSERDAKALDLLLVTDLTPKEIVFGKLGGIFYNTKEMVLLPLALCLYLGWARVVSAENVFYIVGGLAVLYCFVAMLGVHTGLSYASSRSAIAASLGTVFFLFLGIATCLRIMVAFSGSFQVQLQPFLAFMLGGGIGLYAVLGARNPSSAIAVASLLCPFATFYAITSFLLGYTLAVFLVTAVMYGFATAAMLIPAIYEFDVATGRTTGDEE